MRTVLTSSRFDCFFLVSATEPDTEDMGEVGRAGSLEGGSGEAARSGKGDWGRLDAPALREWCVGIGILDMQSGRGGRYKRRLAPGWQKGKRC